MTTPAEPLFSNFSERDLKRLPSIATGQATVREVPWVEATPEALAGYGHLVADFDAAEVTLVTWPQPSWRPIVPGTGNEGGVVRGAFEMQRRGELQLAANRAVGRSYVTGWYADPATASPDREPSDRSRVLTHEANYHPDGGQVFFPRGGQPFVALLAKPGDDVAPEDFVAFAFDGRAGLHVDPGVWHQPPFPLADSVVFDDVQGRVHACVACSFLDDFGLYLAVPLAPRPSADPGKESR